MSTLIVEICKIENVLRHTNADALELAHIKGWQCVVPKGRYSPGDVVTYIPIDAVIPKEHSDRWGITKYLSNGRVRCARLRGEPSFGVIVDIENSAWREGQDVREHYCITKFLPPIKYGAGDVEQPHGLFPEYIDIENLRNFPKVIAEDEEVVITEKIHGTNCRIGIVEGELMAGSMSVRRKRPEGPNAGPGALYWAPLTMPGVEPLLTALATRHRQVVLYGEIFGGKVQNLTYGKNGSIGFRAFDLFVDGKYVDYDAFSAECSVHGVESVPLLYRGSFSMSTARQLANGPTTIGGAHIREGVVVRTSVERMDPKIGRVCLKYIGDDFLLAKGISDTTDI